MLTACERSTVRGKRDYAVLLLLARLGLRAGEIVALQLDDINWANAELAIRSKKGDGWARLPLPADVGRALERYLTGTTTKPIPKRLRPGIRAVHAVRSLRSRRRFGEKGHREGRSEIGPYWGACLPALARY